MAIMLCYRINQHSTKMAGVHKKMLGQLEGLALAGEKKVYALYMSLNRQVLAQFIDGKLIEVKVWEPITIEGEQYNFWQNAKLALDCITLSGVYARYDHMYNDADMFLFFNVAKSKGIVTMLEFPTFPYSSEIDCQKKRLADVNNRTLTLTVVDHIFSTSEEKQILGYKNNFFPNQLSVAQLNSASHSRAGLLKAGTVNILMVANANRWHGIDRLINGMAEYIKNSKRPEAQIQIVGDGKEINNLKKLANHKGLQDYVHFLGFKNGQELTEIYDKASICIASLGLHRLGIDKISPLKTREYLANGLPIVASYQDVVFEGFNSYLMLPSDDTPVDIEAVIAFTKHTDKQVHIRSKIRNFARKNVNWTGHGEALLKLIDSVTPQHKLI